MKFGPRKPSLKKSVKARTTGQIKRNIKKSIDPTYGKKGIGYVKDTEKAIKNNIYHRTTFDSTQSIKSSLKKQNNNVSINNQTINEEHAKKEYNYGFWSLLYFVLTPFFELCGYIFNSKSIIALGIFLLIMAIIYLSKYLKNR